MKLDKSQVRKGIYMHGGTFAPDGREVRRRETASVKPPVVKNDPADDRLAEIREKHESSIAEIVRKLDAVRAGLEVVKKAKRK